MYCGVHDKPEEYAYDLAVECGHDIVRCQWPFSCINWEGAWREPKSVTATPLSSTTAMPVATSSPALSDHDSPTRPIRSRVAHLFR